MGYRDDFYIPQNIIGYSGDINNFPTVYFLSKSEWGHITQRHGTSQNVGRSNVGDAKGYFIGNIKNEATGNVLKLVEAINGRIIHVSRSILIKVGTDDLDAMGKLKNAISQYPSEKYIDSFSRKDFKTIEASMATMADVLEQIKVGVELKPVPPKTRPRSNAICLPRSNFRPRRNAIIGGHRQLDT